MQKTTVKVDGMMCEMCEAHVGDALRKAFPDAEKVTADRENGEAVILSEENVDAAKVKEAIDAAGYTFVSLQESRV